MVDSSCSGSCSSSSSSWDVVKGGRVGISFRSQEETTPSVHLRPRLRRPLRLRVLRAAEVPWRPPMTPRPPAGATGQRHQVRKCVMQILNYIIR